MRVRLPLAAAAAAFTFVGGVVLSQLLVREAHAQSNPFAATVYVPSDGIAFRSFDGRMVARLSYDAHGGVFELYDEHEQVAAHVRGDGLTRTTPAPAPAPTISKRPGVEDFGF